MTFVKTFTSGFAGLLKYVAIVIPLCAAVGAPSEAVASDWNWGPWKSVSGSGTLKTETREVSGFTGIALSLNGSVEIKQGGAESVTIETDDNILPLIETVVENATLKIRPVARNNSFSTKKMKIVVNAKTLTRIDIAGAGDIHSDALKVADLKAGISGAGDLRIKSLEADALSISIAGSGDFEAGGRAASMRANIAGSGDIKAGKLDAKAVEINIAGSGDATVWARNTLKVSIAGSGDVQYYGDAQLQNSIWGSGSVKRLGAAP
ncbi:MAG: DUF2807 domain-containing protein [Rhodocyclaceae bacterium]|nr:MAG: DUF2807 domain-containing protein [Rhodocyclaceae bacterium]